MAARCARLTCSSAAVASTLFVADQSRVEIIELADATAGIPLCADHARRLTPPVGWDLLDRRNRRSSGDDDPWREVADELLRRRKDDPVNETETSETIARALSETA